MRSLQSSQELNRMVEESESVDKRSLVKQAVAENVGNFNRAALLEERSAGAVSRRPGKSAKKMDAKKEYSCSESEVEGYSSKRDRQKGELHKEREEGREEKINGGLQSNQESERK